MTAPTSTQLTHMLTADIRAAIRVQMLPPAALAEALVDAGWRPIETDARPDGESK
jgi:hypothetical protein